MALTMITDLKQVPLGPVVREFVLGYDHDPEQHISLVIDIHWNNKLGCYFDSYDEAEAFCREKRLLRQYPSCTWNRERARAYAEYLDMVVGWLRGKREQPLITTTLALDTHRSEWIRSEELRAAVTHLREALNSAIFWFNVKMVCLWFTWIDPHRMEWPELLKDVAHKEIGQQANLLDRLCYGHGTMLLSSCARPYELIASLEDVPTDTRNVFLLTPNQLQEAARLSVGAGPKKPDKSVIDEVALAEPELPPEPQERRTPGGIYIPNTNTRERR